MSSIFNIPQIDIVLILTIIFFIEFQVLLFLSLRKKRTSNNEKELDKLHQKIKDEILFAVSPKFIDLSINTKDLVDLAIEVWRIKQRIEKSRSGLSSSQVTGFDSSIQRLNKYLDRYDIEVLDHANQKYNNGLNLDILSVDKKPGILESTIKETVEPTVLCKGQVVHRAKVILLSNK